MYGCIDVCLYTHTHGLNSYHIYGMGFIRVCIHIHMFLSHPSFTDIHESFIPATSMDKESFAYLGRFRLGGHFNHVQGYYGSKGSGGNKVADGDNGGYFWG